MEDYLKTIHANQYTGIDDEMSDDFDNYLMDLDVNEWLKLSEDYSLHCQQIFVAGMEVFLKNKNLFKN